MAEQLFNNIIIVTLTTSVIIGALLIFLPLINKKYTAKWRYWVWLLLAIRLLIPFNPQLNLTPIQIAPVLQNVEVTVPLQNTLQTPPAEQQTSSIGNSNSHNNINTITPTQNNTASETITNTSPAQTISLHKILSFLWLFGIIIFLLYHFIGYFLFRKTMLRYARPVTNPDVAEIWNGLIKEKGTGKSIRLLSSKKVKSPMITGFLKPLLLLPETEFGREDLNIVLKHELTHYQRRDIWYKLLLVCANAVHWFNPLVYIMTFRANRDIEMVCDEEMVKASDLTFRKQYSETILSVAHKANVQNTAFSTCLNEGKKSLKERFTNIFDMGMKHKGIIALILVFAAICIAGTLVACNTGSALNTFDNISLRDAGNSYSLDKDGNVILSYNNGEVTVRAPLTLYPDGSNSESGMDEEETGFYISKAMTAVAYGGFSNKPVQVLISKDMGKSWNTYTVTNDMRGSSKFIGFIDENNGWLVLSNFHGMGSEDHYVYKTTDGGKTWTEVNGNINSVYARVLTGAGFSNDKIGFLSFRFENDDFSPAICRTLDGGLTWEKIHITLPKEFDQYYSKTPLSPVFSGAEGLFPIQLTMNDTAGTTKTIYLTSNDYGKTWTYDKQSTTADNTSDGTGDNIVPPDPAVAIPQLMKSILGIQESPTAQQQEEMAQKMGQLGFSVLRYNENMLNYKAADTFFHNAEKGINGEFTIFYYPQANIISCTFTYKNGNMTCHYTSYTAEKTTEEKEVKIDKFDFTDKGNVIYHIEGSSDENGFRITPLSNESREYFRKYVVPADILTSGPINTSWDSNNYSKLNWDWIFEALWSRENDIPILDSRSPYYHKAADSTSFDSAVVPQKAVEDTLQKYFSVSVETLRAIKEYDKNTGTYNFYGFRGGGYSPTLEVSKWQNNADGSLTLWVDFVALEFGNELSAQSTLTVMPQKDGGFKYLSNLYTIGRFYDYELLYAYKNTQPTDVAKLSRVISLLQLGRELPVDSAEYIAERNMISIRYRMNLTKGQTYHVNFSKWMQDTVMLLALFDDVEAVEINLTQGDYGFGGVPITREQAEQAAGGIIINFAETKQKFVSEFPGRIQAIIYNPGVMSEIPYDHVVGPD